MKITPVLGYYDQWGVGFHFWRFYLKFYFKETVNVIYYKKKKQKKQRNLGLFSFAPSSCRCCECSCSSSSSSPLVAMHRPQSSITACYTPICTAGGIYVVNLKAFAYKLLLTVFYFFTRTV